MMFVTIMFLFIFSIIFLILFFCNKKNTKSRQATGHTKVHFKIGIFKNLYAEFDYEINNDISNT